MGVHHFIKAALAAALTLGLTACGGGDEGPNDAAQLASRVQELELRAERVADLDAVKRLQAAYGYYLDAGLWNDAADLFADDGTIEYGLDGVYVGRERVREYLLAYGEGLEGLKPGRLETHMQIMPVVTLAADGRSAKARWRDVQMLGAYNEYALWGEGPMENTYVKEDGVWKIQSVHWVQNMLVPYQYGWLRTPDANGGVRVSPELPPDRPPSVEYETWPGVYMPPFHFANPVADPEPSPAEVVAGVEPPANASQNELVQRAATLAQEIALLEDENEIENLQRIFGFYLDEALWSEAAALFADDATIELGYRGVYEGADRILAFLRTLGPEGPVDGRLYDHLQLQPVVHVAPDGQTAKGRWRLFAQVAEHGAFAEWGLGVYENDYVKEDGVWKIADMHLYETMRTPYEAGWAVLPKGLNGPSETLPPDHPQTVEYSAYPGVFNPPFHYESPVTGAAVYNGEAADFASAPPAADDLAATLDDLERRLGLVEDFEAIERLDTIRGYYLARSQWDDSAALFAEDGVIEIAMRGVYRGRESVRRNLDLYTEPGVHHGLLHNHMQIQPVIHVDPDGQTASMRAHALSIMGEFETYANWMGGVYENRYVKRDGVWQIAEDHQYNTYFAPYAVGWKDLPQRDPPGINPDNPPDEPPSHPFAMYPTAFVPPFHYANPVTGEPYTGPEWAPE